MKSPPNTSAIPLETEKPNVDQVPGAADSPIKAMLQCEPILEPLKPQVGELHEARLTSTLVAFDPTVTVIIIPSRIDYSDATKSRLWADRKEIADMATRNTLEFAAEGFDWRNALEEEDMVCIGSKTVHPIHSNPLLAAALSRNIPYPRPMSIEHRGISVDDHEEEEPEGAVCDLVETLIDRPSSPFLEDIFDSPNEFETVDVASFSGVSSLNRGILLDRDCSSQLFGRVAHNF